MLLNLAAVAPCWCCCSATLENFPKTVVAFLVVHNLSSLTRSPLPSAGVGGFYCQDDTMKHQVAVHQRLFREIECGRLLHPVHPSGFKGVFQFCKIFVPIFCYPYVFCIHISHLSTASQTTEGSWLRHLSMLSSQEASSRSSCSSCRPQRVVL